jgi:hypothetical protein
MAMELVVSSEPKEPTASRTIRPTAPSACPSAGGRELATTGPPRSGCLATWCWEWQGIAGRRGMEALMPKTRWSLRHVHSLARGEQDVRDGPGRSS